MKIAIYSRKSKFTGRGESIENQIELCREYAEKHYGSAEYLIYEDEGFSGGTIERPQFQKMLHDAKKKKFDVLICYRLDRVSRNIADFSVLIEELQKHGISFVSIRERFDTSTPMGRAMMYIASVFAQLERETIAERIKDNMLELAKTGRWLGGVPPLGFKSEKISYIDNEYKERSLVKLKPVENEMKEVEVLYDKYLELGSIHQVRKYLIQKNKKTKNKAYFSSRVISDILKNPAYAKVNSKVVEYLESKGITVVGQDRINNKRGILIYNKKNKSGIQNDPSEWIAAVAKHNGYISAEKWLQVQHQLDENNKEIPRAGTSEIALLSGILRCAECGSPMNVTYGRKRKDGTAPHYYTCNLKIISGREKCRNPNANGIDLDHTVINKLLELSSSKEMLIKELEALKKNSQDRDSITLRIYELKSRKEELMKQIKNLIDELSKSSTASKYIIPQIEKRDTEIKEIDEEISKLEDEQSKKQKEVENFDMFVNNLLNFKDVADKLSNIEKKNFLRTIIDKVFWNGNTKEVSIKLITESSQFKSASGRASYKNHSIRALNQIL
jgi:DNA invertase Pin-like site-specific DNA recombinase